MLMFILFSLFPSLTLGEICGDSMDLERNYLEELKEAGDITMFSPSVYYEGSSSKFISTTGEEELDHPYLCVDGATSYDGSILLYDDGNYLFDTKHGIISKTSYLNFI